jgi:hypothetical protein
MPEHIHLDPCARLIGSVTDMDGGPVHIGVDADCVTIANAEDACFTRAMREEFTRLWCEAERAAEAWATAHPEAFAGCNAAPRCVNGPEPHAWGVTCRLKDAARGEVR